MTRSKLLWFAALVLVTIAAVCFNSSGGEYGWQPMIVGAPAIMSAVGLLFEKRWSEYVSYGALAFAVFVWLKLTFSSWEVVPLREALSAAHELLPGAVLATLCFGAMAAIYRFFRATSLRRPQ